MRIDLFLYRIRLVKSRTLAQAIIENGHVRVNGKRIQKCSEGVHAGDVIAMPLRGQVRVLRVVALPRRRGPAPEVTTCYLELASE